MEPLYDPEIGYVLPEIPLHEARQIMTRADFIQSYDQINVFTISSTAMVRAGERFFLLVLIFMVLRILLRRRPFLWSRWHSVYIRFGVIDLPFKAREKTRSALESESI